MNLEQLNARFNELVGLERQAKEAIIQDTANLHAIEGAKQDVQYWLNKIADAVDTTPPVEATNDNFTPMQETSPTETQE